MEPGSIKACFKKALQILARRDHSRTELSKKLQARGFTQSQIDAVTDECIRLDYLNDIRFARAYMQELHRKGYGINAVKHKLYAKGVSKKIVGDIIAPHSVDSVQVELCRGVLAKKLKPMTDGKPLGDLRPKLQRFLLSRGFSVHIIYQAMDDAGHQWGNLDGKA